VTSPSQGDGLVSAKEYRRLVAEVRQDKAALRASAAESMRRASAAVVARLLPVPDTDRPLELRGAPAWCHTVVHPTRIPFHVGGIVACCGVWPGGSTTARASSTPAGWPRPA
jgi:hypothetical protein